VVGVGPDDDGCGDRSDAGLILQSRHEGVGELVKLAMVLLEQGALLEDRDREPSGLATSNRERICNGRAATGSPGSDGPDLGVGERVAGIDVQVDGAQQRSERVTVRSALLVDDRP
jgi:hypothetical protein